MNCPQQDALIATVLNEPVAADAAAHIVACPACQRELAALRATLGLLADPAAAVPAPDLRARVLSRLAAPAAPAQRSARQLPFLVRRPLLAAALLLFALALFNVLTPAGGPPVPVAQAPTAPDISGSDLFSGDDLALWQELDELELAFNDCEAEYAAFDADV